MIDPELAGVKTSSVVEEKPKRKRSIRKTKKEAPVEEVKGEGEE